MDLILALSLMGNLAVALFVLLCIGLILIILLQKGRGGGLGAAFGGGGAGSLLGTKTGDFLTWVTIALVAGFLVLAVLMGKFMRPSVSTSTLAAPAPAAAEQTLSGEADEPAMESEATDEAAQTEQPAAEAPAATEQADEAAPETTE
jgi:preprotein translocase subunit SecG